MQYITQLSIILEVKSLNNFQKVLPKYNNFMNLQEGWTQFCHWSLHVAGWRVLEQGWENAGLGGIPSPAIKP